MVWPCGSNTDGLSVTKTRALRMRRSRPRLRPRSSARTRGRRSRRRSAAARSRSNARSISAGEQHARRRRRSASSSALKSRCSCERRAWRCAAPTRRPARARRRVCASSSSTGPENTTPRERVEVLAHALRVHDHARDDPREAAQHVIERDEAVGQDDALDRRVRDVALVPERDVLERRRGVGREAAARGRRSARSRSGCACAASPTSPSGPCANGSSTSPISVFCRPRISSANFSSDAAVIASAASSSACRSRWMTCDDDRRRLEAEPRGRRPPRSTGAGARTCRPRPRACRRAPSRARAAHALEVAADLRVPERQLQAERHRLGVDAVRAADHRRAPVLLGARSRTASASASRSVEDQVARLAHLQRLRRVDDVRRGQAEVQPARRRPDLLGHRRRERDHVVLGGLLDLVDARDVERARARGCRAPRRRARCRPSAIASVAASLHLQPGLVPALRRSRCAPISGCV